MRLKRGKVQCRSAFLASIEISSRHLRLAFDACRKDIESRQQVARSLFDADQFRTFLRTALYTIRLRRLSIACAHHLKAVAHTAVCCIELLEKG